MTMKPYIHKAMNALGRKVKSPTIVGTLHPNKPYRWTEARFDGNPAIGPRMRTK